MSELPGCMTGPSEPCDAFTKIQDERDRLRASEKALLDRVAAVETDSKRLLALGCHYEDRAKRAEASEKALLGALILARKELEDYERTATGETYNSPAINAAIAQATKRG